MFTPLSQQVEELPTAFTFPFQYTPHPLSIEATRDLQQRLQQEDFHHDFDALGKMFGVLVVKSTAGELGYLAAFSGKLGDKNILPGFVPPVYDRLTDDGFFIEEEKAITALNHQIQSMESSEELKTLKNELSSTKEQAQEAIDNSQQKKKEAKKQRDIQRKSMINSLSEEEYLRANAELEHESKDIFYEHKRLRQAWKARVEEAEQKLNNYLDQINEFKKQRQELSALLQKKLFDQYQFLNANGQLRGVCPIFEDAIDALPPAGAGDCAAPKLLQYAYQQGYKPICMAEFWWGKSPKQAIRKHGHYYPACRGKCEPILGHMLQGLSVEPDPRQTKPDNIQPLEIVWEDEHLLAINKPHNLLSVPGKVRKTSVYEMIQQQYPQATGPLLVHRLDMATSGILLIAKNEDIYKALQAQFIDRTVKKRYVALLEGKLVKPQGIIELPLRVDLDNRPHQLVCYTHGKHAKTTYEVIRWTPKGTLVYFYPHTGRTHQLRVHAAHQDGLNCPIVGDDLYGTPGQRLYLHAEHLSFIHPVTEQPITLEIPASFML